MKLNQQKVTIESYGLEEEKFFGIKDLGMIFDILRSKLYSNPILAICREISCNARDSHREAGIENEPIVIYLPTYLEPYYKIQDFGVGISPERIESIFINYAASTKRDDNIQTGGFGIGSKTPFSYSDSFNITTIFNGIKYQYSCFIDETKIGKLALLSTEKQLIASSNGTEICIPVKNSDFNLFNQYTEQACRHWKVKPIIKGGEIIWKTLAPVIQGNDWKIVKISEYQYEGKARLVIDGIEYPIEIEALQKYADPALINSIMGTLIMYFGIGEISLSANREQIYLDQTTQIKIKEKINSIKNEIFTSIQNKIDSFSNLWDANVYYINDLYQNFSDVKFLGSVKWKNFTLSNSHHFNVGCKIVHFTKGKYSRKYGTDHNKLSRSVSFNINLNNNCELYINDLDIKEPTTIHIKKAFIDNPKLTNVQIICPTNTCSEIDLNKKINLDQMQPKRLSSITKAKGRGSKNYTTRLTIFKFDESGLFHQTSNSAMNKDSKDKVLCFLEKNASFIRYPLVNDRQINLTLFKMICQKFSDTSFYGIDVNTDKKRIKEDFGGLINLEEFLNIIIDNDKDCDFIKNKFIEKNHNQIDHDILCISNVLKPLIQDKANTFYKRILLHEELDGFSKYKNLLFPIYEIVKGQISDTKINNFIKNNSQLDIIKINNEYVKKYPLMEALNSYNYKLYIKQIAHYINVIDKT